MQRTVTWLTKSSHYTPASKSNQIGFFCLFHLHLAESQPSPAAPEFHVTVLCKVFPPCQTTSHLDFVHNQHFYYMCGTPAAALALTRRVKRCDTGSFLQATLHLQMSGSRVTHAGESMLLCNSIRGAVQLPLIQKTLDIEF